MIQVLGEEYRLRSPSILPKPLESNSTTPEPLNPSDSQPIHYQLLR